MTNKSKIRTIAKGTTFSPTTDVDLDAKSVHAIRTAAHKSLGDDAKLVIDWTFDWSNTPLEQVYIMATNDAVIRARREVAAASDSELPALLGPDRIIDPMDYVTERKSQFQKIAGAAVNLSADDKAALLAMLTS
jgi:hypothetical protein